MQAMPISELVQARKLPIIDFQHYDFSGWHELPIVKIRL
jgi:hypothetical protein